ncbi:CsiV family protein [Pseudidiomarina insulisalsae]|nr:CsiV family protein [Pseudidiomarina insulisalsae]
MSYSQGHKLRRLGIMLGTLLTVVSLSIGSSFAKPPDVPVNQWRWFEIEVLLFKHSDADNLTESFPWQGPEEPQGVRFDPLSDYFAPDISAALADLPECTLPGAVPSFAAASIWCRQPQELNPWLPQNWSRSERTLATMPQAPERIIDGMGGNVGLATAPFLAPQEQLELSDMREQIIRRGVGTPLLHMSWYQPVFERNDGYKIRLFAGTNFGDQFSPDGYPYVLTDDQTAAATDEQALSSSHELASRLRRVIGLQQAGELQFSAQADDQPLAPPPLLRPPETPTAVWEVDGTLHIYLVGNYLHIASDLELRAPESVQWQPAELSEQAQRALEPQRDGRFLRSYKLDQLRRVISHETHYFDHPKLGLAVQIRRTGLSARRY